MLVFDFHIIGNKQACQTALMQILSGEQSICEWKLSSEFVMYSTLPRTKF